MSLPLIYILIWPFIYILSCIESVLLVFGLFSEIVVIYSCSFCLFMGGGELRNFLLHHLDLEPRMGDILK